LVVNRNWALDDSPEDLLPDPSIDGRAQVSGTNEVGAKERIGFADPTILYLDGWYYIPASLSGGPIQSGPNFDMLKSRNLIDWVVHARGMLNSDVEGRINCREFSAMGSPQLYIDPAVPNSIRLLFNATENPCYPDNSDACNASQINVRTCANQSTWTIEGNVEFATTPMVTSIAVASFLASPPGHFGESQPAEPWRFTYRWNGNAVSPPDGGWTAGVPVPCSVNYCASANGCCNSFTTPPSDSGDCRHLRKYEDRWYFPQIPNDPDWTQNSPYGPVPLGATTMRGDSFVYFDELCASCSGSAATPWLIFGWRNKQSSSCSLFGSHLAAFPMRTEELYRLRVLDAAQSPAKFVPIAYRYTTQADEFLPFGLQCQADYAATLNAIDPVCWPKPTGDFMYNGTSGRFAELGGESVLNGPQDPGTNDYCPCAQPWQGSQICYEPLDTLGAGGAVEGPGAFNYISGESIRRTYVYYSRNGFSSPAYGIYCRTFDRSTAAGDFSTCGLNSWTEAQPQSANPERPLIWSASRGVPRARAYGHGEIFWGPAPSVNGPGVCDDGSGNRPKRPYLIFHTKIDNDLRRYLSFKELYFNPDGTIHTIEDSSANLGGRYDPSIFLVPWDGPACWGQIGDYNKNGVKSIQDIYDFLPFFYSNDPLADVNGSGMVSVQDILDFLADYYMPCWASPTDDWNG